MNDLAIPSETMGAALERRIRGRRLLIVTDAQRTSDAVQLALEGVGVAIQRLDTDQRVRLDDLDGQPLLPHGQIAIVDVTTLQHVVTADTHMAARIADAIKTTLERSHDGSTEHLHMTIRVSDVFETSLPVNMVMDRLVEAAMVDDFGGIDRVPTHVLERMNWAPARLADGPRRAADPAARARDDAMDRLFGDDVTQAERRMRGVYVLRAEHLSRDVGRIMVAGPERSAGFDPRAVNQAFNMRRGRQGLGFPGKGKRLRK